MTTLPLAYKEFKSFFKNNPAYVKHFNMFAKGRYTVDSMTEKSFNEDMQKLFIAFFTFVNTPTDGRVAFIKEWCANGKGRATQVLKLYGSNSIIYKIKEETLTNETWLRLWQCMLDVTIIENNLQYLFDPIELQENIKLSKTKFIKYFTTEGKNNKESFNKFIGIDWYTETVINGTRNFSQGVNIEFQKFIGLSTEPDIKKEITLYFSKNTKVKRELASLLYKQLYAKSSTQAFDYLYANKSTLTKATRTKIMRVITECKKIYA